MACVTNEEYTVFGVCTSFAEFGGGGGSDSMRVCLGNSLTRSLIAECKNMCQNDLVVACTCFCYL